MADNWTKYKTQSGYRIYPTSDNSGGWITACLTIDQAERIVDFHNRSVANLTTVEVVNKSYNVESIIKFLREAAAYFSKRDTNSEDKAHWSNVYNEINCNKAADLIDEQAKQIASLSSITSISKANTND
ncbi:MAG: hypothetical protein GY941_29850 [Planctomycetes bacterium]|nr:hypothetical protein [Planctomycetota bacterium]